MSLRRPKLSTSKGSSVPRRRRRRRRRRLLLVLKQGYCFEVFVLCLLVCKLFVKAVVKVDCKAWNILGNRE